MRLCDESKEAAAREYRRERTRRFAWDDWREMASAIAHFIVGSALALPAMNAASLRGISPRWVIPLTAGFLAVSPDFDTLTMDAFQIPYGSFFGHRGFSHSAVCLSVLALLLAMVVGRRSRPAIPILAVVFAGCAITHPLLDMLTDGGQGVMILAPFSTERLFFGWRPIHVSPLSIVRFFSGAGYILKSELPFDLAAVVVGLTGMLLGRQSAETSKTRETSNIG